ncbi:MAG TPA: winged helix-turn-helix domain-containing protein [Steroidobacteraceae bacterium]|nr:winged helix-turn-helix domain-containing protein [Steroidobacteraceae bacterium]
MSASGQQNVRIRFADYEADLQSQELFRDGVPVRLPNQSFLALSMLIERPGRLVTREELRARLWPDHRVVEFEQGLNAIINRLREALGDSADSPRFVETLPRRGYRFIGQLTDAGPSPATPAATATATAAPANAALPPRVRVVAAAVIALIALAITAMAARWLPDGTRTSTSVDHEPSTAPLTTLLGQEHMPAWSPDGSRVLFAWEGEPGRGFDLYVRPVDSERLLRLTRTPAAAIAGTWSPDGSRIAFARMDAHAAGLFVIDAAGGAERKLADGAFTQEALMQPSWSPDGATLAFSAVDPGGSHGVRLLDLASLSVRSLPTPECWHAGAPAFSADGRQLAWLCIRSVAVYEVYLATSGGSNPRRIAHFRGLPQGLAWRDARHLLVANDSGDGTGIWTLELDGRLERPDIVEDSLAPGLAAHDNRAVYARARQVIDIWRLAIGEPGATARKWIYSTRAQITPSYSPDGARIAFQSNRSGNPEIWIADADGANAARLTSFNGPLTGGPAWCADGRRLAFDSRESGVSAVYVMDTLERVPRRVATSQPNLALPVWSGDCRFLLASDGRESLYRVSAQGGEARRFTDHRSYQAAMAGERVVFNVAGPNGVTLWTKPLENGAEAPLPGMPPLAYADGWATTAQAIYFTDGAANPVAVRRYDLATGKIDTVGTLPNIPTPLGGLGLAVSADGKSLLYTHTEDTQSDLVLLR